MESRREHLWHLLQMGMSSTDVPKSPVSRESPKEQHKSDSPNSTPPSKTKRQPKKPKQPTPPENATTTSETPNLPPDKKKQTRKKTTSAADKEITTSAPSHKGIDQNNLADTIPKTTEAKSKAEKKSGTRVGQRKPKRDIVGNESQPGNAWKW